MAAQPAPWARQAERGAYVEHLKVQRVASRDLSRALRDAANDARRRMARIIPDSGVGEAVRRAQLAEAERALRQISTTLWDDVGSITAKGLTQAADIAVAENAFLVEYLTRSGADVGTLGRQFELAAKQSAQNVRAKYLNDVQLSDRVYRNGQRGIQRAQREVVRGIAQSRSAAEIANRVKHLINPNTPGGISYAAKRLARTEINNAFHGVNAENYANSPFVEAVQWNLSSSHPGDLLDECVDYAEGEPDGIGIGLFRPQNVPAKPHPNCLCFTVAATVSPEKFADTLTSGGYDSWLAQNGFADVRFAA